MSNPAINIPSMDIGPCNVKWNGTDLGGTLDNVVVNFKYMKANIMADQTGETVLDKAVSGVEVTVVTSIVQTRDKDILALIFPNADVVTVGPQVYLQWNNKVAVRDLPQAQQLVLHPLVEDDAVTDYDWNFYKAMSNEESSVTIGPGEQYKLSITWQIFPDTSVQPYRFFRYGDLTI